MTTKEQEKRIEEILLNMNRPFNIADLRLIARKNNLNYKICVNVLDNLCDSGKFKYQEIRSDIWAFIPIRKMM